MYEENVRMQKITILLYIVESVLGQEELESTRSSIYKVLYQETTCWSERGAYQGLRGWWLGESSGWREGFGGEVGCIPERSCKPDVFHLVWWKRPLECLLFSNIGFETFFFHLFYIQILTKWFVKAGCCVSCL